MSARGKHAAGPAGGAGAGSAAVLAAAVAAQRCARQDDNAAFPHGAVLLRAGQLMAAGAQPAYISAPERLAQLGSFCRRRGRDACQGEIGLVIGDEYLAFRDFTKE